MAYEVVQFPLFLYVMVSSSVSDHQFFKVYAFLLAGSGCVRFGVIHELFRNLSQTYSSLARFSRFGFRSLVGVLLLIGVGLVAFFWPENVVELSGFSTYVLDRAVSLLQLGLLPGLFGIAIFFGLSLRNHVFGITLGFALYLSVQFMVTAVHVEWESLKFLVYISMAAFYISVLIWLRYVLVAEPESKLMSLPEHADIAAWSHELERLLESK
jgi:hypothetical protein